MSKIYLELHMKHLKVLIFFNVSFNLYKTQLKHTLLINAALITILYLRNNAWVTYNTGYI